MPIYSYNYCDGIHIRLVQNFPFILIYVDANADCRWPTNNKATSPVAYSPQPGIYWYCPRGRQWHMITWRMALGLITKYHFYYHLILRCSIHQHSYWDSLWGLKMFHWSNSFLFKIEQRSKVRGSSCVAAQSRFTVVIRSGYITQHQGASHVFEDFKVDRRLLSRQDRCNLDPASLLQSAMCLIFQESLRVVSDGYFFVADISLHIGDMEYTISWLERRYRWCNICSRRRARDFLPSDPHFCCHFCTWRLPQTWMRPRCLLRLTCLNPSLLSALRRLRPCFRPLWMCPAHVDE